MATKEAEYYEALESGVTTLDNGEQESFRKGEVISKDWVGFKGRTKFRDDLFKPAESLGRGEVEAATAAPGEKRGSKSTKKSEEKD